MKFYPKPFALGMLVALILWSIFPMPAHAMNRPAVAWRLFQAKYPCPCTKAKTGPCPGWIMVYKKPLEKGGDIAPYNLKWVRK
jgi:hypothetical protein